MTPKNDEWTTSAVRALLRAAIPVEDFGSRMAIQYAPEIAQFLGTFKLRIVPMEGHDPETIRIANEYLDELDRPLHQ